MEHVVKEGLDGVGEFLRYLHLLPIHPPLHPRRDLEGRLHRFHLLRPPRRRPPPILRRIRLPRPPIPLKLSWTISNSQPCTTSTSVGSGNHHSDLRSWLSTALGNQDTCQESLDETSGVIGSLVAGGLQIIPSLIFDGLRQVDLGVGGNAGRRRLMGKVNDRFPQWVSVGDPPIDFQSISYYSEPKLHSLDEADPELLIGWSRRRR